MLPPVSGPSVRRADPVGPGAACAAPGILGWRCRLLQSVLGGFEHGGDHDAYGTVFHVDRRDAINALTISDALCFKGSLTLSASPNMSSNPSTAECIAKAS